MPRRSPRQALPGDRRRAGRGVHRHRVQQLQPSGHGVPRRARPGAGRGRAAGLYRSGSGGPTAEPRPHRHPGPAVHRGAVLRVRGPGRGQLHRRVGHELPERRPEHAADRRGVDRRPASAVGNAVVDGSSSTRFPPTTRTCGGSWTASCRPSSSTHRPTCPVSTGSAATTGPAPAPSGSSSSAWPPSHRRDHRDRPPAATPAPPRARRTCDEPASVHRNRILGLQDALARSASTTCRSNNARPTPTAAGADALHALLDRRPDLTAVGALRTSWRWVRWTAPASADCPCRRTDRHRLRRHPAGRRAGLTTVSQPLIDKGRIAGELYLSHRPAARPGGGCSPPTSRCVRPAARPRFSTQ